MVLAVAERPPVLKAHGPQASGPLNPLETEVIDLFVQLSRLLAQRRSLAEIYGFALQPGGPCPGAWTGEAVAEQGTERPALPAAGCQDVGSLSARRTGN